MELPTVAQLDAASELLESLAREHGLSNLRHGSEEGELVVDVEAARSYFDVVRFMADVDGRLGFRPDVLPSGAPGAAPGRSIGSSDTHAA